MVELAVGAVLFWGPAYLVGRLLIRQLAAELRRAAFGDPKDDPRYRR